MDVHGNIWRLQLFSDGFNCWCFFPATNHRFCDEVPVIKTGRSQAYFTARVTEAGEVESRANVDSVDRLREDSNILQAVEQHMCILWLFVRWRSFQAHWRFCMENCGWTGRWCAAGWRLCRSTKDMICRKVGGERCAGDLSDALNQYCSQSNPNEASPLPSVHLNTNNN